MNHRKKFIEVGLPIRRIAVRTAITHEEARSG